MSLGVLNNLSAMYAENNLNNTTNSLNTVLQQLSSARRSTPEQMMPPVFPWWMGCRRTPRRWPSRRPTPGGRGFLQVADGALSQVTSLLNRAVTLATEASNGTLNIIAGHGRQPGVPVDSVGNF